MFPTVDEESGNLPIGRHNVTLPEIHEYYVGSERFTSSQSRPAIWEEFLGVIEVVRGIVPVICVWVGGSFVTGKIDPNDIDIVFWFNDIELERAIRSKNNSDMELLGRIVTNQVEGLPVHSFYGRWYLEPGIGANKSESYSQYLGARGFWDDFWLRARTGDSESPSQLSDALPRRGYFEVILDGFNGL